MSYHPLQCEGRESVGAISGCEKNYLAHNHVGRSSGAAKAVPILIQMTHAKRVLTLSFHVTNANTRNLPILGWLFRTKLSESVQESTRLGKASIAGSKHVIENHLLVSWGA